MNKLTLENIGINKILSDIPFYSHGEGLRIIIRKPEYDEFNENCYYSKNKDNDKLIYENCPSCYFLQFQPNCKFNKHEIDYNFIISESGDSVEALSEYYGPYENFNDALESIEIIVKLFSKMKDFPILIEYDFEFIEKLPFYDYEKNFIDIMQKNKWGEFSEEYLESQPETTSQIEIFSVFKEGKLIKIGRPKISGKYMEDSLIVEFEKNDKKYRSYFKSWGSKFGSGIELISTKEIK